MHNLTVVIPARFNSRRLPGKALLSIGGIPMVCRVFESCQKSGLITYVATDSEDIARHIPKNHVIMTSQTHSCGTERIFEASQRLSLKGFIVNVQGDMPFFDGNILKDFARFLTKCPTNSIATMIYGLSGAQGEKDASSPSCVTVAWSKDTQRCVWFSRDTICETKNPFFAWGHVGIYGYSCVMLKKFCMLPSSPLEKRYALEQLRYLENGYDIFAMPYEGSVLSVDTPEDMQYAQEHMSVLSNR